jgi:hypothetical protein
MRLSPLLWLLVLFAAPLLRGAGINFIPRSDTHFVDGFSVQESYLVAGPQQRIYFTAPTGWTVSGSPEVMRCFESKKLDASCRVGLSALIPSRTPLGGDSLEVYRRQALSDVPPDATAVTVVATTADFFTLFGWSSLEIELSYTLYAQQFRSSVMFLNIGHDEQLRVVSTAKREDFDGFRASTLRLLTSWCPRAVP